MEGGGQWSEERLIVRQGKFARISMSSSTLLRFVPVNGCGEYQKGDPDREAAKYCVLVPC